MTNRKLVVAALLLAYAVYDPATAQRRAEAPGPKVILIIGDGIDQNQITIARNYPEPISKSRNGS